LEVRAPNWGGLTLRPHYGQRFIDPPSIWNYNTGETFVVGAVVGGATHQPQAKYLTDKIWSRWGMESDAKW
jgi:CubicO group peptidase (beta-lactamase class C family)